MNAGSKVGIKEVATEAGVSIATVSRALRGLHHVNPETRKKILDAAGDRPVVFRTLDLGGDKVLPYARWEREENPALGWRAIRIALDRPALLRYQVRAMLTASVGRTLRILLPMVSDVDEFNRARALIDREDKPDPLRRLASVLAAGTDATALGKRLKLSTQQALRLDVMLAAKPALDVTGGAKAWRAGIHHLGNTLYADRLLLEIDAPGDWQAALALARSWTPPELPVSGGDVLALGLAPGPRVGAVIAAIERWWIDGDFSADRTACLAHLEHLVRAR